MASFQAINTVCEAVLQLLRSNYRLEDFDNNELEFKVYLAKDFTQKMNAGVSLFLYRIFFNGNHRTPCQRFEKDGKHFEIQLPVDLHFLLTAWGKNASLQHTIAGWMMRTLEDTPILQAGFLNGVSPGVFRDDETVEIVLADLKTEDLLRLWEVTAQNEYQISVPYLARNISIESTRLLTVGKPVQERDFFYIVRG
jgi:hypothetical protein